ncbi:MerR family transcriptional regulator [Pendulispora rubella]|uniref:MerR family transcriptional regulator n=1 Tax=Pendulispora rubella TaxID=2741070 RepID=A0ABZ2LBC0_9BACT
MAKERLTIGELGRRTGMPVKTLRFYSDEGLLPPAERSRSGYRLYGEEALVRLDLVRTLRDAGLGLDSIKKVLQREASLADALRLRLAAVEAHIASLQRIGSALRAALRSEPTADDVRRICAVTRLSTEQRKAVIEGFFETAFQGADVDEAFKRQVLESTVPDLPEDPTPEQHDAWIELSELLAEPTFVANLQKQAKNALNKSEMAAMQRACEAIADGVRDAVVRGIAPDSADARAVVERYAATLAEARGVPLDDALRHDVYDRFHSDPRVERYWALIVIMNDTPEMRRQFAEGKWTSDAVLHHFHP